MAKEKIPPVINPTVDVGDHLAFVIGETGGVEPMMGGYRIRIFHTGAFPWDEVFKILLFRDFKVYVNRHKADLFIEAMP
jgi:hypothetical protein